MTETKNRYFVRGMSRSGGTLMATILDAHPDIAMGYELYEHLLEPDPEQGIFCIQDLISQIYGIAISEGWLNSKPKTKIAQKTKTLVARARRGGGRRKIVCKHFARICLTAR